MGISRHGFRHYLDLVIILTHKELKVRYKSSVLGYLWSIFHPLAFALVFYVAFKIIMRIDMDNYTLFLLTALYSWQWFANSLAVAPTVFLNNASLIKKLNFQSHSLLAASNIQDMIHYLLSIPIILIFLVAGGERIPYSLIWWTPILCFIQFAMSFGMGLIIASVNLFFRDIERLVSIGLMLLFYFTPIIYPLEMVPEKYQVYFYFNPAAHLMMAWRSLFMEGRVVPEHLALSSLYATLFLGAGSLIYSRLSRRFAEAL